MKYLVSVFAIGAALACSKPQPPSPEFIREQQKIGAFNALFTYASGKQRAGKHEDAVDAFRAAINEKPDGEGVATVWNDLGWSLLELKKHNEAIGAFKKALALQPANPKARNNLTLAQNMLAQAAVGVSGKTGATGAVGGTGKPGVVGPTGRTPPKPAPAPAPAPK